MAAMPAGVQFEGQLAWLVDGQEHCHDVVLCCPGDWPEIRETIEDVEAWSTVRLGPFLLAAGPAYGTGLERILDRLRAADRVLALDHGRAGD